jgi:hypothetical protein
LVAAVLTRSKKIEAVEQLLESYAQRGVFKGFSRIPTRDGSCLFRFVWHRNEIFELLVDLKSGTLRFPVLLRAVTARSEMDRELKQFVASRHSEELPEHRRINADRAQATCRNNRGDVALTIKVLDGDYEYAARKSIHLVHEVFMTFLLDGRYYDYVVETFGLDPDQV